jgi:two-component system nitrogen regulation sensor histidine kinase GlnL
MVRGSTTISRRNPVRQSGAEQFFDMGAGLLVRQRTADITPFGSPLIQVIAQARERGASVGERDVDLSTPRHGERIADVT